MTTDSANSGFVATQVVVREPVDSDEPDGDDGFCFDLCLPDLHHEMTDRAFYFVDEETT